MRRRELLTRGGGLAAGLLGLPLLAACGVDEPAPAGARAEAPVAQRVVVLGLEDEAVALGVRPVGVGETHAGDVAPHLRRALRGVRRLGPSYEPSLERVAALRPDLIVLDQYTDEAVGRQLAQIAEKAVVRLGDAGGVEGASDHLLQVGRALGLERRARERAAEHERRMADARRRLAGAREPVAFLRVRPDELRLVTPTWGYIGPVLYGDLGLTPAPVVLAAERRDDTPRDGHVTLSLERIPSIDARRLFHLSEDDEAFERVTRVWRRVPAVREGRTHAVDPVVWQTTAVLANEVKARDVLRAIVAGGGA